MWWWIVAAGCGGGPVDEGPPPADDTVDRPDPVGQDGRQLGRSLTRDELRRVVFEELGVDVDPAAWLPEETEERGFEHLDPSARSPDALQGVLGWAAAVAAAATSIPEATDLLVVWQGEDLRWGASHTAALEGFPFTLVAGLPSGGDAQFEVGDGGATDWEMLALVGARFGEEASWVVSLDGEVLETVEATPGTWTPLTLLRTGSLAAGLHTVRVEAAQTGGLPVEPWRLPPTAWLAVDALGWREAAPAHAPPAPWRCAGAEDDDEACTRVGLQSLAEAFWRRPMVEAERDALGAVVDAALAEDGVLAARRDGIEAILAAPSAMHLPGGTGDDGDGQPVEPWVRASRLSFALWSSGPDAALRACAPAGLRADDDGPCGLAAQVDRMIADPRAMAWVDRFGLRWLRVHAVELLAPNPRVSLAASPELHVDYLAETRAVLADTWQSDADVRTLLTRTSSFATTRIALRYGVDGGAERALEPIDLEGTGRVGVLGHGSVLATTAQGAVPSVVDRGVWVVRTWFCETPEAPPNVPPLPEGDDIGALMEEHLNNPACASCHADIDPYGVPMQAWDAEGLAQAAPEPVPLPGGDTPADLAGLASLLAADPRVAACVVERAASFAWAREVGSGDGTSLAEIQAAAEADGFSLPAIARAIVLHPSFFGEVR